jgi:hypothetical protein
MHDEPVIAALIRGAVMATRTSGNGARVEPKSRLKTRSKNEEHQRGQDPHLPRGGGRFMGVPEMENPVSMPL